MGQKSAAYWLIRIVSIGLAFAFCFLLANLASHKDDYTQRLIALAGLYVTLAVSLNLINGITGQFSIGHAAFYQVGAYSAAFISYFYYSKSGPLQGIWWLLAMMAAGAVFAAIAGFVVGLPSLRLRGDYLAIVTLGFGEIVRILAQNIQLKKAGAVESVGGTYGMNVEPTIKFTWLIWLLAIVCIAVCRNLLKTAHGLPFLAVREDEVASSAMGVNTAKTKLTAFIIGSAFAGAAGAIFAHFNSFVNPDLFRMDVSFMILTMVVLGGTGSITGSALSAITLFYVPEYLRTIKNPDQTPGTVSGAALIATIFAIVFVISMLRRIQHRYHGKAVNKVWLSIAAFVGGIVVSIALRPIFGSVPQLAAKQYAIEQLRMVIFASTLIILMLLRPQGVFAHHEFSWDWVKRVLRLKKPTEATAT